MGFLNFPYFCPMSDMIRTAQLSKRYAGRETYAVKDLSLTIDRSEIFGLLGPNGAGKTTLISMLCGMLKPTSGELAIDGLEYRRHRRRIQQRIGVVPQEYALSPTLTARENLAYFGSLYDLPRKELQSRIGDGLEQVGLAKFQHQRVDTFSGGMKRRINLLSAILHRPAVLFLDEPTVGVDVQSKKAIMALLVRLHEAGTTIVYTSHMLNEAQDFCTRVAVVDEGRIVLSGRPAELVASHAGANNLEDVFVDVVGNQLRDHA